MKIFKTKRQKLYRTLAALLIFNICLPASAQSGLKDVFGKYFLIGAALNSAQFSGKDERGAALVKKHFNTISPENVLKWEAVQPLPGKYNFEAADRYVAFGEKNKIFVIGHALVWHNQTPSWVFKDKNGKPPGRVELLKVMRDHIFTVVGRYRGRIKGWDVVNEALNEDGTLRQSAWLKIIGEDYIAKAFEFAHEADPSAELYYNDYSLENEAKRRGALELIKKLLARKIPVKAVGLQGHNNFDFPTLRQQEETISQFAALGVKLMITELDIDVLPRPANYDDGAEVSQNFELKEKMNPYADGLPDAVQQTLAERYAELFRIYLKHRKDITRITFWGVTDRDSWKNNFPIRGRTNYPLLFDRQGKPKPAFDAIIRLAKEM
jgi:endo-1,4-beta-xylanase